MERNKNDLNENVKALRGEHSKKSLSESLSFGIRKVGNRHLSKKVRFSLRE